MKVEAILAHDLNHVIGSGDTIPWHHSGDFKRFKKITTGHNLLMGARTFLGIAKNYFSQEPGKVVLPGRTIFVVGRPSTIAPQAQGEYRGIHRVGHGSDWVHLVHELVTEFRKIGIDYKNVRIILDEEDPRTVIDRIEMNYLQRGEMLFVAGGAKTYHRYLPFATKIHQTIIETVVEGENLVRLHADTVEQLYSPCQPSKSSQWASYVHQGDEMAGDLKASYYMIG